MHFNNVINNNMLRIKPMIIGLYRYMQVDLFNILLINFQMQFILF